MPPKQCTDVVSMIALSKAIDKAAALPAKRQDVAFETGTITLDWVIIGSRIRSTKDFNAATR